ncbi:MAG: hypothetical protein SNJ62_05340, partial [Chloracidobacterium sp.]
MFPAHFLTRIRCPNIEKIGRVRVPVLILHAENDTTVPLAMAEALARSAFDGGNRQVMQLTLPGGNHDTTFALPGGDAIRAMQAFAGVPPLRKSSSAAAQADGGGAASPSAAVRSMAVGATTAATMNKQ